MAVHTADKKTRKSGIRFGRIFTVLIALVALVSLFRIFQQLHDLYLVHRETTKTEKRVEEIKEENARLEEEKNNLGDMKYIEKVARDEHNMVGKNEIPLFLIDENKPDGAKK
jgi:cell division protein DivIC